MNGIVRQAASGSHDHPAGLEASGSHDHRVGLEASGRCHRRARVTLVRVALTAIVAVAVSAGCRAPAPVSAPLPVPAAAPKLILARGENLARAKAMLDSGDPRLRSAYAAVLDRATTALTAPRASVTDKTRMPPSGDKRDYMSLGPYWWPDTTKPDGLPFIRRDGVVNPESRRDHDGWRFQAMASAVQDLALAQYFTGDPKYGAAALEHLRAWFLDSATRMNPNAQYAQSIPGVSAGRGVGIIDLRHMPHLLDAIRLLDHAGALPTAERDSLTSWFRAYLHWLRTSKNGRDERAAENNHGTWYDAQAASLALFVGDSAFARELIDVSARQRIAAQIAPDGSQPHELERTRPLHYSLFNLDPYTQLAEMGRHIGVDLWTWRAANSGSIVDALRLVAPYTDRTKVWPKPDVASVEAGVFLVPLRRAADATGDPAFAAALDRLPPALTRSHTSALFHPGTTSAGQSAAESLMTRALDHAAQRLRASAVSLDPADGYPRFTRPDGTWETRAANQWTSGFFAGALWYMFQETGNIEWRRLAEKWTDSLERVKTIRTTHDLGFMLFDSFGHGYLLTGSPHYRDVVLEGSRSLVTRYNPTVGAIKSWDTERQRDHRGQWKYPVIVDNLMNLEMLFWAARHGGDTSWHALAERHARTSARAHVRPDGSTAHVALFDPATGALEATVTWQGYSDSSTWARGQAWAIHGLTTSYGYTRNPELLTAARRVADYFIGNLPDDGVPYWDFRHPLIPRAERDASAAAIAASGLFDLARRVQGADAERYRAAAERILEALASDYLTVGTPSAAILLHSVGGRPQDVEVDVGIIYADYYFVEALLRRKGLFLE